MTEYLCSLMRGDDGSCSLYNSNYIEIHTPRIVALQVRPYKAALFP